MSDQKDQGGLSVQTLIIASLASLTAAIVVHEVWEGGAILGAAITPIIVAITSEMLRKPTQRITAIREERVTRPRVAPRQEREGERAVAPARAQRPATPPPPEFERPDPFGIWQDDGPSWRDRLGARHLKIALVTGLLAFAVGVLALTGTEIVVGGSVGGGDRTTVFGGERGDRGRDEDETRTTDTQPRPTTPAVPGEEQPAPEETTPAPTAPPPTATTPPAQTAPPAEGQPAPQAPAPELPAPEAPVP